MERNIFAHGGDEHFYIKGGHTFLHFSPGGGRNIFHMKGRTNILHKEGGGPTFYVRGGGGVCNVDSHKLEEYVNESKIVVSKATNLSTRVRIQNGCTALNFSYHI